MLFRSTLTGSDNASRLCNYTQTWNPDKSGVAEIKTSGKAVSVTGVTAGEVIITHTYCSKDDIHNKRHTIANEEITIEVKAPALESLEITGENTVMTGNTVQLTATANPAAAETELTWTSNNTDVLTVDENGVVTGVAEGDATVTAKDKTTGVEATHTVTVKEHVPLTSLTVRSEEHTSELQSPR